MARFKRRGKFRGKKSFHRGGRKTKRYSKPMSPRGGYRM